MNIIQTENLVRDFNSFRAVDHISFQVEKGEIFGLLGPNGAGKTTTIRMLTGVLEPTEGCARIGGYDIQEDPIQAKQMMGIVPEMANAYIDLSAMNNLLLMGELYGISREKRKRRAEELLKAFKLYEKRKQKVKTFSKGMKQRVILGMALMNDAEILFLDEPTGGLDVESTRLIHQMIRQFSREGTTVFLTTHNIEEANILCDRTAIMNYGRIVAIDSPEKLKSAIQSTSSVAVAFRKTVELEALQFKGVSSVEKEGDKYRLYSREVEKVIPKLVHYAEETGNTVISLKTLGPSLEDVFVKLTKGGET